MPHFEVLFASEPFKPLEHSLSKVAFQDGVGFARLNVPMEVFLKRNYVVRFSHRSEKKPVRAFSAIVLRKAWKRIFCSFQHICISGIVFAAENKSIIIYRRYY